MRNETWLEELACEPRARGVAPTDVAGVVAELQGHLRASTSTTVSVDGPATASMSAGLLHDLVVIALCVVVVVAGSRHAPYRQPAPQRWT